MPWGKGRGCRCGTPSWRHSVVPLNKRHRGRAVKGPYIVWGCAGSSETIKPGLAPAIPLQHDYLRSSAELNFDLCSPGYTSKACRRSVPHSYRKWHLFFLIALQCAWIIKVLALIKCQTMCLEKCWSLNKSDSTAQLSGAIWKHLVFSIHLPFSRCK